MTHESRLHALGGPDDRTRLCVLAGVRPEMVREDGPDMARDPLHRVGIAFDVPQGAKRESSGSGVPE
jgi:hypothetical protein